MSASFVEALHATLRCLAAVGLLASVAWTGFVLTHRWLGAVPASVRLAGTFGVASWLLVALFLILASMGLFQLEVALPAWAALLAACHRRWGAPAVHQAREDLALLRSLTPALRTSPWRWLVLGGVSVMGLRLLRGLVAPPLAWDSLTYHLVKAASWVQRGGWLAPEPAPDAWGYYEYFGPYGDVFWAWAMLPSRGDAFLAPAGMLIWLFVLVTAYALARALQARRGLAGVVALLVALTPAVANSVTSGYIDNTVLALVLLGLLFLVRPLQGASARELVLAVAAFALAAGVRPMLPQLLLASALALWLALRRREAAVRLPSLCTGFLVAGAVALPPYLRAWWLTGSPLYPWSLQLPGGLHLPGNAQFLHVTSGALSPEPLRFLSLLGKALLSHPFTGRIGDHLGLGPGVLLALPLGLLGAWLLLRERHTRPVALLLGGCAALTLVGLSVPGVRALWTLWADVSWRLCMPAVAVLLLLASTLRHRLVEPFLLLCAVLSLVLVVPVGWSLEDWRWLAPLLLAVAVSAGLGWAALRCLSRGRAVLLGGALALGAFVLAAVSLFELRRESRYPLYRAATRFRVYDLHPLHPTYTRSVELWAAVDDGPAHRLAVTAGWDGVGHNWYRYPLMGSRLQNTLVYVPISTDGRILDYQDDTASRRGADYAAWRSRLLAGNIDILVSLPPSGLEGEWAEAHPEHFELLARGAGTSGAAYRVKR